MSIQLEHFFIPIADDREAIDECNRFLRAVKVLELERECISEKGVVGWSILIHYLQTEAKSTKSKKAKIDYKEVLSDEDFLIFSELRKKRKLLAEADGVPVYSVFTNEQLAEIARSKITTVAALSAVEGVGEAKLKKYSDILAVVTTLHTELP